MIHLKRIRRFDYIQYVVLLITANFIISAVAKEPFLQLVIFFVIIDITLIVFLTIMRLHDINKSGWFSLLILIPIVNLVIFIALFLTDGVEGTNIYGKDPKGRIKKSHKINYNNRNENVENFIEKTKESLNTTQNYISQSIKTLKRSTEVSIINNNLIGTNWVLLINENLDEIIYIFRKNKELIVSKNGLVEFLTYDFVTHSNKIIITNNHNKTTELYDIISIKNELLILKRLVNKEFYFFYKQINLDKTSKDKLLLLLKNEYN